MGGALVLTVDPAWPPVSGADHRNWHNASALARRGPVVLASVFPSRAANPSPNISLASFVSPQGTPVRHRASIEPPLNAPAVSSLVQIASDLRPDVIIVEGVGLASILAPLRPLARSLILDMHNIESAIAEDRAAAGPWWNVPKWIHDARDIKRIQRLEQLALRTVDSIWVCSAEDADRLRAPRGLLVHIVPNGIPNADRAPTELPRLAAAGAAPTLLFSGHLRYAPNVEAVHRLTRNILPRVRAAFPNARLIVAGRNPGRSVEALCSRPGITLVADPPDIAPLLSKAHVVAVPLSSGGGTRIKILEAMAWGVPVVATERAAEGLGLTDGVNIARADTDDAIASVVIALLRDPERIARQRAAEYRDVRARFSPDNISAAVQAALA